MIVEARVVVPASLPDATSRLRALFRHPQMDGFASAAAEEGDAVLMRAGVAGVRKEIAVQALKPVLGPGRVVVGLRWVATGSTGDLFPALDGNLELRELADGSTELALVGSYRPPLGRTGEVLDQILLNRVARGTVRSFVSQLAIAISAPLPDPDVALPA